MNPETIFPHNSNHGILNYSKWNRYLLNLYWIYNVIILVTEIAIFVFCYQETFSERHSPTIYALRFIATPSLIILFVTVVSELMVAFFDKKSQIYQPYIITFTSVIFYAVLILIHNSINVIYVTCIIPIIFSLTYDNKRILRYTSLLSLICFYTVFVYLTLTPERHPYFQLNLFEALTNIGIISVTYLICEVILNRFKEIIDTMSASEHSAYEAKRNKERAEAALEARMLFFASVSHEIRTPMNGIVGLSELALADTTISAKQKDYLSKISSSANSLLDIVNDILDISKMDAGEFVLENRAFELHKVFRESLEIVAHKAKEKALSLHFIDETNLERQIIGDPTKLRQSLLNLLSNAIKFTSRGSVTLKARSKNALDRNDNIKIYFEISDTGIGMNEEQCNQIFEPFRQVNDNINRVYEGTGLGLTITNSIIKKMGGKIRVESAPNAGSKFSFTLEFALANEKDEQLDKKDEYVMIDFPHFHGNVLLCEDNEINRQVAKEHLERLGFHVVIAENGVLGRNAVKDSLREQNPFALILMDIHMPVMDGLEATKEILQIYDKSLIIAMTANTILEENERYIELGMTDCIQKPFKFPDLYSCLLKHIPPIKEAECAQNINYGMVGKNMIDKNLGMEYAAWNEALYQKLLIKFSAEQGEVPALLEKAIADKNYSLAFKIAHTSKSVALTIGAVRLSEQLAALEKALAGDISEYNSHMLIDYKKELKSVIAFITEQLIQK